MSRVPATGAEGYILRSLDGHGQLVFRVYHPAGGGFTDYDIDHTDLQVKITDEDAYFYGDKILDHAPETLGLEECDHEPDHNGECLKCDEPVWFDEEEPKEILWLDPISPSEHGVTEEMMKSTPQLEWFFRDYQRWIERYNIK